MAEQQRENPEETILERARDAAYENIETPQGIHNISKIRAEIAKEIKEKSGKGHSENEVSDNYINANDYLEIHLADKLPKHLNPPHHKEMTEQEQQRYFDLLLEHLNLEKPYEEALNTLATGDSPLYKPENFRQGDVPAPSLEQCIRALFHHLTPEQLEVIATMEKPTFQIIPTTSSERYLNYLNGLQPMENQQDAYVSEWIQGALERADQRDGIPTIESLQEEGNSGEEISEQRDRITGWRVAITEGTNAPKILEGDDLSKRLRERVKWFEDNYKNKGLQGMTIKQWILLWMRSQAEDPPRVIDNATERDGTWTMCNGEEIYNNRVAGAFWDDRFRRVYLRGRLTVGDVLSARFRASVVVDVL